jgi:hypothetical protein
VKQARETISDLNYLMNLDAAAYFSDDTLRYEKAMLREWFRKRFYDHE